VRKPAECPWGQLGFPLRSTRRAGLTALTRHSVEPRAGNYVMAAGIQKWVASREPGAPAEPCRQGDLPAGAENPQRKLSNTRHGRTSDRASCLFLKENTLRVRLWLQPVIPRGCLVSQPAFNPDSPLDGRLKACEPRLLPARPTRPWPSSERTRRAEGEAAGEKPERAAENSSQLHPWLLTPPSLSGGPFLSRCSINRRRRRPLMASFCSRSISCRIFSVAVFAA